MSPPPSATGVSDDLAPGEVTDDAEGDRLEPGRSVRGREREVKWGVIAVTVLPLLVSAVCVVAFVRGKFKPIGDYALMEMQVRDIGHHPVLLGLYSRDTWAHPGPTLFYMMAPLYWLTGHGSYSMSLTALLINGASVAGMGVLAWRRGGMRMLLCTLLACALVLRTMSAWFLYDIWNCYIPTLPFGLLLFAVWSLLCRDKKVLPLAVFLASFLAQTHIGFVVLALPLLAIGVVGLVVPALRKGTPRAERRDLGKWVLVSFALGVVLWIPSIVDALTGHPSNLSQVLDYFRSSTEKTHSLKTGWRVVTGQFSWPSEWLVAKRQDRAGGGASPFVWDTALPWLLLLVVAATVLAWVRRGRDGARQMTIVLGAAIALGVVAVMRTLGPAVDYRLRWTWMPPLFAFVLVTSTAWSLVSERWPRAERRVLVPAAIGAIAVVSVVNIVVATQAGVPWKPDSEVMAVLTPQLMDHVEPGKGQVLISDPMNQASWYARGIVLELERRGVDARVPDRRKVLFGKHRVFDPKAPVQARYVVVMGDTVDLFLKNPRYELIARWQIDKDALRVVNARRAKIINRRLEAGDISAARAIREVRSLPAVPKPPNATVTDDVGVFETTATNPRPAG